MQNWKATISELLLISTQDELAEKLNVTQGYISHFLTGRRKNPSYALGVKINELHKQHLQEIQKAKTPSGN